MDRSSFKEVGEGGNLYTALFEPRTVWLDHYIIVMVQHYSYGESVQGWSSGTNTLRDGTMMQYWNWNNTSLNKVMM